MQQRGSSPLPPPSYAEAVRRSLPKQPERPDSSRVICLSKRRSHELNLHLNANINANSKATFNEHLNRGLSPSAAILGALSSPQFSDVDEKKKKDKGDCDNKARHLCTHPCGTVGVMGCLLFVLGVFLLMLTQERRRGECAFIPT